MSIKITKETSYLTEVEDRPGVLAQVTKILADAGINLSLLGGWPCGAGRANICCVPDDAAKLKSLAASHGASLKEQTVFVVRGDDEVGALVEVAQKLANAGISIRALSALSVEGKFAAMVDVAEADVPRAAAALGVSCCP